MIFVIMGDYMKIKERELEKVNSADIKRYEKTLAEIDKYETSLISDFDKNIQVILGDIFVPILREIEKNIKVIDNNYRIVRVNGNDIKLPNNFLQTFHKSYISDSNLRTKFENKLKMWFSDKTEQIKNAINDKNNYDDVIKVLSPAYALSSLALTAFHKQPNMILRDVQKMTGLAISEGSISELGTGEGKTLSAILPTYLFALRGKGAHIITANDYLARRDFEETLPIFEGLGLTSGYLPTDETSIAEIEGKDPENLSKTDRIKLQEKIKIIKQKAYKCDITYGSKQTFAFDYLRDNNISRKEDMLQREERPGFGLIDEVDDVLIDDAQVPYRIAMKTPMYVPNMSLRDLCIMQNIPYDEILPKVADLGIKNDTLTYEEARYISNVFGKKELLSDPQKYQEAAQRFFKMQKVLITEDNKYGFKTGKELYEALLNEDKYDSEEIRKDYGIILCRELREYKISDKCYEDFLKYCYFSFQINSEVIKNQARILRDSNYKQNEDYIISNTGKMKLTMKGAEKILRDDNYPDFIDNYYRYLSGISTEAGSLIHFLQKAVVANLLMKKGEDYIIEAGKIKTLKNGRIQEGSTYSDGQHQAIEIKENISVENRTKVTTASSTITQKDFYSRYDMFSGMTGTSSKEVFKEIFGKNTIEIPKHVFYSFYGRRKKQNAKEPVGVEKKKTEFAATKGEKIDLIVNSIVDSLSKNPKQPVLLVVSDVDEIKLLELALITKKIKYNTLTATTSKENEALIIARAGLPGMVTISTEMAGRGTDIKIGGDRDTIIDIMTQRHIRALEKKQQAQLDFSQTQKDFLRKKVEEFLINSKNVKLWTKEEEQNLRKSMELTGLKVISSGFYKVNRIDRQLEGRTGRNGLSGVCERFACPEDIKRIGIPSFDSKESITDFFQKIPKKATGALDLDDATYERVTQVIKIKQKNNEADVKSYIMSSQKLDSYATGMVEEYRDKRRKVICGDTNTKSSMIEMIESATDAIICSYIVNKEIKKEDLTTPINQNKNLEINVDAISLEVKQMLGISFDPNVVTKSNINLLELRDAIVRTAKQRLSNVSSEQSKEALLVQNDYMIANIPDILEHSFAVRNLAYMSAGMEGQADYEGDMEFVRSRERLRLEACKQGVKCAIGLPLTKEEFIKLESLKSRMFSLSVKKSEDKKEQYEVKDAKYEKNNIGVIERFKAIKAKVDAKNQKQIEKIERKIDRAQEKGKEIDIKALYSKLNVRPMKFISSMVDGKTVCKLVIVRDRKKIQQSKGTSLR